MMKNKKTMSVIGVAAGVCILTSAAFANYQTANGYEALKQSLFNLPKYENYTMDFDFAVSTDGTTIATVSEYQEFDKASELSHSKGESTTADGESYSNENWSQDGKDIWKNSDGTYQGVDDVIFSGGMSSLGLTGNEETDQKIIRFLELLSDTLVGDLKNNFVCVEDGENSATYEVNLTSVQIPELVNAGLGAVFSMQNYYYDTAEYYEDAELSEPDRIVQNLGSDPRVDSVKCRFTVNKDNTLQNGEMTVVFAGEDKNGARHDFTVNGTLDFSNVGTTTVQKLDLNSVDVEFLGTGESADVESEYEITVEDDIAE